MEPGLGSQFCAPTLQDPKYDDHGDIEYFIQQFLEVAEVNGWDQASSLLHLPRTLKEDAQDYGKAQGIVGIFQALPAGFGFTQRMARASLAGLRKETKTTLQEHASDMQRLTAVA